MSRRRQKKDDDFSDVDPTALIVGKPRASSNLSSQNESKNTTDLSQSPSEQSPSNSSASVRISSTIPQEGEKPTLQLSEETTFDKAISNDGSSDSILKPMDSIHDSQNANYLEQEKISGDTSKQTSTESSPKQVLLVKIITPDEEPPTIQTTSAKDTQLSSLLSVAEENNSTPLGKVRSMTDVNLQHPMEPLHHQDFQAAAITTSVSSSPSSTPSSLHKRTISASWANGSSSSNLSSADNRRDSSLQTTVVATAETVTDKSIVSEGDSVIDTTVSSTVPTVTIDREEERARQEAYWEKEQKRLKDQLNATREILQTEITYVKQLKMCDEFFMQPLNESIRSGNPILPPEDYNSVFLDLGIIINVNKELLKSLEDWFRWKNLLKDGKDYDSSVKEADRALGKIFLKMTPFLKSYKTYCSRYDSNFKMVNERKKSHKKFKAFLEKTEFQPSVNFASLDSFLILPVQRIPRYNLLLTELIKHTKPEEPDYKELCDALKEIQKVAVTVNDHMKELEVKQKILEVTGQIADLPFEIVQPSRRHIQQGEISYLSSRKGPTTRYLFLFNDLLCITKPSNSSSDTLELIQKGISPYDFRSAVSFTQLPKCIVVDIPDGEYVSNAFWFGTPMKTWTFFTKTLDEKKDWMQKIQHWIDDTEKNTVSMNVKDKQISQIRIQPDGLVAKYLVLDPKTYPKNDKYYPSVVFLPHRTNEEEDLRKRKAEEEKKKKKNSGLFGIFGQKVGTERPTTPKVIRMRGDGKNVYELSDSEEEEEDPPEVTPELHVKMNKKYAEELMHEMLIMSLKAQEQKEKRTMVSLHEEYDRVILNPLFGVRKFARQSLYWQNVKLTYKMVDEEFKLYKHHVLSQMTLKSLSIDDTVKFAQEDDYIPDSSTDEKKLKKAVFEY